MTASLTDRERQVLEAVIETYVQTAEPAGSRTIAKRHQLGLSPATIRNGSILTSSVRSAMGGPKRGRRLPPARRLICASIL